MIKVLIVEDDPMVAELNKRYVESLTGFKVISVVSNGEDALGLLQSTEIDLLILDIYMPKMNGISLMEKMRTNFINTDVILVTAAKEAKEIDEALKLGAVDYLIKPFDKNRIKKSLNNYLARYKLLHGKDTFRQEDIDKITNSNAYCDDTELEKGVHKNTLRIIWNFIGNRNIFLTSEEVAEGTGLSRVTVRRYLDYLVTKGDVVSKVEYGSIGRPSYLYKSVKK